MAGVGEKVRDEWEDDGNEPGCEEGNGHCGKRDGNVDVEDWEGLGEEIGDGHGHYGGDEGQWAVYTVVSLYFRAMVRRLFLKIIGGKVTHIKTKASFVRRFTLSDCERPAFVCTKLARSASKETFVLKIAISRIKRSMSRAIEPHKYIASCSSLRNMWSCICRFCLLSLSMVALGDVDGSS